MKQQITCIINKSFGGNVAIKVDITKAFDTTNWNFLVHVLRKFWFQPQYFVIGSNPFLLMHFFQFQSMKNLIVFSTAPGVRQGDPLSPFLFFLAEEILSRSITKLVEEGSLKLIKSSRDNYTPSHVLYIDDILIFSKGYVSNVNVLKNLFTTYHVASSQKMNSYKSHIYYSSLSQDRIILHQHNEFLSWFLTFHVSWSAYFHRQGQGPQPQA